LADNKNIKDVVVFLEKEIIKAKKLEDGGDRKNGEK
jgi:hypothetical protein